MSIKFSLILATKDRKNEVEKFLHSLLNQTYSNFELIICDQNSDRFIEHLISHFRNKLNFIYFKTPTGLSLSRNFGISFASGDIIAFPDDDCEYPPDLLEKVKTYFENEKLHVLCGRPITKDFKTTAGKYLKKKALATLTNSPFIFCSFTMFIKREVIEKVGNFDERLGLGSNSLFMAGEDLDYGIRIIKNNFIVIYDPNIVVYHPDKTRAINDYTIIRSFFYELSAGVVLKRHNYPKIRGIIYLSRPLCGALLSILTMRPKKSKFHFFKFLGRSLGFLLPDKNLEKVIGRTSYMSLKLR